MTEYRMLGPYECPDHRLGDEARGLSASSVWIATTMSGHIPVKDCHCEYRRPIKQEEKPVTGFKVGDTVKITRKVVPDGWSDVWTKNMDAAVGQVGVIEWVSCGDRYYVKAGEVYGYHYPKEALELVSRAYNQDDEPVVKEPSPQVYDWCTRDSAIYGVTEKEALEWFDERVHRAAEDAVDGESTVTLFRSHTIATIKKTVEISVKSVDGAE